MVSITNDVFIRPDPTPRIFKAIKMMKTARSIAEVHSKDTSTKVSCLITDPDGSPLVWGYNGFPRGVMEFNPWYHSPDGSREQRALYERTQRPEKYFWTEHAERNAMYNAARKGIKLEGGIAYITPLRPCVDCARGLIQVGISEIVVDALAFDESNPRVVAWAADWDKLKVMLGEAGVKVYKVFVDTPGLDIQDSLVELV